MARSRILKPGFYKNEELAQCTPHARLCFAGLWLLADREGRLEDRPLRIKAELFPYENLDLNVTLNELAEHGFIRRYVAKSERFIAVMTFGKHQSPHVKESQSTIPAPDKSDTSTRLEPVEPSLDPLVLVLDPGSCSCIDPDSDPETDPVSERAKNARPSVSLSASPKPNGNGKNGAHVSGTVDAELADRAARFCERYGELYQQLRRGARYLPKPSLDWSKACELCAVWPNARLEMLATVFLKTDHDFAASGSRTIGQFAALASWCDDRLREVETGV